MFGLHLVERGLLTHEQLYRALNLQEQRTPPLGQIALTERTLSVKQVLAILKEQAGTDRRFGETAVALGHLTNDKVAWLLRLQREARPPIEEVVCDQGWAERDRIAEELRLYSSKLE